MAMDDAVAGALEKLQKYAQVLHPQDVDEPILAPAVSRAVYEWLIELHSREELAKAKVQPRRFALLYGPPGTGKTTLAHHLAARLGLPLVAVQTERMIDMYLGQSEKNVAALFELLIPLEGRCVLLLDEFDAMARSRTKDEQATSRTMDRALNVLLVKVEAFRGIALAATNMKDSIDAAMWRRFGLQISVDLPAEEQRFAIIRKYGLPFDLEDEAIDVLVKVTRGCSPSLLRQLMEGMKRALILAPKLKLDASSPARVFGNVIAAIAPPPEMAQPPLWTDAGTSLEALSAIAWPPARRDA